MTTTISEIADERRLYENIAKRHREAWKQEQIRLAQVNQPSGVEAFLVRMRRVMVASVSPAPGQPAAASSVVEAGSAEQPARSVAGQ